MKKLIAATLILSAFTAHAQMDETDFAAQACGAYTQMETAAREELMGVRRLLIIERERLQSARINRNKAAITKAEAMVETLNAKYNEAILSYREATSLKNETCG